MDLEALGYPEPGSYRAMVQSRWLTETAAHLEATVQGGKMSRDPVDLLRDLETLRDALARECETLAADIDGRAIR